MRIKFDAEEKEICIKMDGERFEFLDYAIYCLKQESQDAEAAGLQELLDEMVEKYEMD